MLNKKWIPTPMPSQEQDDDQAVEVGSVTSPKWRRLQVVMRLLQLGLNLFLLWLRRQWYPEKYGIITRNFFESLGFLWIKAGQLVALRQDFFATEFCTELAKLQYNAKGFSPELSRRIIEKELGKSIECVFDSFENYPFAAASLSQVHKARLRSEKREVAVKVMRPGTVEIFAQDMKVAQSLIKKLSRLKVLSFLKLDEAVWELDQMRREETDFRYELANTKQMRSSLKNHRRVYVAKPFAGYCTKSVFVSEFIEGVLMAEYIGMAGKDPGAVAAWEKQNNIDPAALGEEFYMCSMRCLFEDNLFHADPHPGNILLLRDNRFVFIDFGTVGSSERTMWRRHLSYSKAIAVGNYELAADICLSYIPEIPVTADVEMMRQDILRTMRSWQMAAPVAELPYIQKSVAIYLQVEILKIGYKYGFLFDWEFMKLDRSWVTMDTSIGTLNPRADFPRLYRKYFRERESRRLPKLSCPRTFLSSITNETEDILSNTNLMAQQMRSASRLFEASESVISNAAAILFGSFARIVALFGCYCVAVLLHQHHNFFGRIGYGQGDILHSIMKIITLAPILDYFVWSCAIIATVFIWYRLNRLMIRFRRNEVRLPE